MKRYFLILASTICLFACGGDDDGKNNGNGTDKSVGTLIGDVDYKIANQEDLDNVIIQMRQYHNDSIVAGFWRIPRSGVHEIDLPVGKYKLNLEGNRCKSKDLPMIVEIEKNYDRHIDINVERLYYSMIIEYLGKELNQGDTISLDNKGVLDIINKYSSNSLKWNISSISWIKLSENSGVILGGKSNSFTFELEKDKLPKYGWNYANMILTTPSDYGSFTIVVRAFKGGGEPEKAIVTGNNENTCPNPSVILTANAVGATSYEWYKENSIIGKSVSNIYEVTESGVYYAIGKNSNGTGKGQKSDGKMVVVKICLPIPQTATVFGNSKNNCETDGERVTLIASAPNATEYKWYKGNTYLGAFGNTHIVNESGTYYVKGLNMSGESLEFSNGKTVAISSCSPNNPTNVKAVMSSDGGIKITWDKASLATNGYEIQICDNSNMNCSNNVRIGNVTSPSYIFEANSLFCGKNYFRVKAIGSLESSSGAITFCDRVVSISKPKLEETLSSIVRNDIIEFDWTGSVGSPTIQYNVERKKGDAPWEVITTTTGLTYSESLPKETKFGVAYYMQYRIIAKTTVCGKQFDSGYSSIVQKYVSWIN